MSDMTNAERKEQIQRRIRTMVQELGDIESSTTDRTDRGTSFELQKKYYTGLVSKPPKFYLSEIYSDDFNESSMITEKAVE